MRASAQPFVWTRAVRRDPNAETAAPFKLSVHLNGAVEETSVIVANAQGLERLLSATERGNSSCSNVASDNLADTRLDRTQSNRFNKRKLRAKQSIGCNVMTKSTML